MTIFSESGPLEGLTPVDLIPAIETPDFTYSAPIAQRALPSYLTDFQGLSFSGTFLTTDDRNNASIGFMTILRDDSNSDEIPHYYNGYGVAIRPSLDASQLNVFIVDNALAIQTVVLENIIHTGWGDFAYLAATHTDILPNTEYNFRIDIGDGNTLSIWIWGISSVAPGVPTLIYGSYIPVSNGLSWGVSTSITDGYHWKWDNLSLSHLTSNYAINLYELDASDFTENFAIKASAYGYGYDSSTGRQEYGVIMQIWNYTTKEWDDLDSHNSGRSSYPNNINMSSHDLSISDYVKSSDGKARVALVSTFPSSFANSIDSMIIVDNIYLECWDSASSHVGGMGDIYIKTNDGPYECSIDISNVDEKEWLLASNIKIDGDLDLPAIWIKNIELLDAAGQPTGISLEQLTSWTFVVNSVEKRYSPKEENYIVFSGAALGSDVRITYYSYPSLKTMQNYCDSATRRNVTDDYLIKSYTPAELFLNITYNGSLSPITARTILAEWINSSNKKTLTSTDVAIKLQAESEVNDATINEMRYTLIENDGDTTTSSGLILTLSDREHFVLISDAMHVEITTI